MTDCSTCHTAYGLNTGTYASRPQACCRRTELQAERSVDTAVRKVQHSIRVQPKKQAYIRCNQVCKGVATSHINFVDDVSRRNAHQSETLTKVSDCVWHRDCRTLCNIAHSYRPDAHLKPFPGIMYLKPNYDA